MNNSKAGTLRDHMLVLPRSRDPVAWERTADIFAVLIAAALPDIAGRHLRRRVAGSVRPHDRPQKLRANSQTSLLRVANYVVRARGGGNAMVRSPVERSPLRGKPDRKTASTARADLPFSSLKSWSVGIHSL